MYNRNKLNYSLAVFILFICNILYVFAQSGLEMSVSGYVINENTNSNFQGVEIFLNKIENGIFTNTYSSKSDQNGYYKIRFLEAGKYQFSIGIPNIGIVHIIMVAFGGSTIDNYYEFDIQEGRNINLNFLLLEGCYPYIERVDNKVYNQINFRYQYIKPLHQQQYISTNLPYKSRVNSCDNLQISEPIPNAVDDDKIILTKKGEECEALFSFQLTVSYFVECKNEKCEFSNFEANISASISFHHLTWYNKRYPDRSEELNSCNRQCALDHENVHYNDLCNITCPEWEDFLNSLENLSICCNTDKTNSNMEMNETDKCKKEMSKKIAELSNSIDEKIPEDPAYAVSNECRNKCFDEYGSGNK